MRPDPPDVREAEPPQQAVSVCCESDCCESDQRARAAGRALNDWIVEAIATRSLSSGIGYGWS